MIRPIGLFGLTLATACAACSSCKSTSSSGPASDAAPAASSMASSSVPAPPSASALGAPRKKQLPCRVLAVQGDVRTEAGSPVAAHSLLDGATWVRLAAGAKLSTRHTVSTRELYADGPALVLPCTAGTEDWVVAEGTVETVTGAGARPGAEVLLFTPFGTVSYGDAHLQLRVLEKKAELLAFGGEGWVSPAASAKLAGKNAIAGPKGKATLSGTASPGALVEACEKAADEAEQRVKAVLGPSDAGTLGDRAAEHLRARRAARAACGAARAAAAREKDAGKRRDLDARLGRAERRWHAIPPPMPSFVPPKSSGG